MPFYREYDPVEEEYIVNRGRTGELPPPQTGRGVTADGFVVARTTNKYGTLKPPTPVAVTFPGPNEPIVLKDGRISPRWWRFFDELYRRTGGVVDNINTLPNIGLLLGAPDELAFTGNAPTISRTIFIYEFPATGSAALTGQAVTIVNTS